MTKEELLKYLKSDHWKTLKRQARETRARAKRLEKPKADSDWLSGKATYPCNRRRSEPPSKFVESDWE